MLEQENTSVFILTEDTGALWRKLTNGDIQTLPGARDYFAEINGILSEALSENDIKTESFPEEVIDSALSQKVRSLLSTEQNSLCICLDRFLLESIESDPELKNRFIRMSICRTTSGERVSRQAAPAISDQIQTLAQDYPDINKKTILLVDDGIFSGGTVTTALQYLSALGVRKEQCTALGFIGNSESEKLEASGLKVEILNPVENLYDWVDQRDFGVFGGKMLNKSSSGMLSTAIPYLYPWSGGEGASFDMFGNLFTICKKIISAQIKLFESWESELKRTISFNDLIRSGFPFPTDINKSIPIFRSTRVADYLRTCNARIETEERRSVVLFDMDGTMYQLDSREKGYKGSTLERTVLANTRNLIIETESCSEKTAQTVLDQGVNDPIGLSAFLGRRYGISRKEYFDRVWNISPKGLVKNFDIPIQKVRQLALTEKKLVLVTSAPRVWQRRVLDYLGLQNSFEAVYTGEQFGTKDEIFRLFARRYRPENITSVGDQEKTDLEPAKALGMKTFLITSPADLARLTI